MRRLAAGQIAPPGDQDDDGIPDPLDLLIGAHKTVLDAADYDDGYFSLKYPNGDPPRNRGACVDVVIRAVRNAGVDLQVAVIEDERAEEEGRRRIVREALDSGVQTQREELGRDSVAADRAIAQRLRPRAHPLELGASVHEPGLLASEFGGSRVSGSRVSEVSGVSGHKD